MASTDLRSVLSPYYRVIQGTRCAYCGDRAQCGDHVVPVTAMQTLVMSGLTITSHIVPCCNECNLVASSETFDTFEKKRTYVRDRLRKRYASLLQQVPCSLEEMADESDETILENIIDRITVVRKKRRIEGRLLYQHTYHISTEFNPSARQTWDRPCPGCGTIMTYKTQQGFDLATTEKRECSSCNQKRYHSVPEGWICTCKCSGCGEPRNHKNYVTCEKPYHACSSCGKELRKRQRVP